MSLPERDRLRQIVNDYYHGLMTAESYRRERTALLDNIGSRPLDQADTTATRPQVLDEGPEIGDSPTTESRKSPSRSIVIVATMVVVLAAIVAAVWFLPLPTSKSTSMPAERDYVSIAAGPERGSALLEEFIERNDWKPDSLGNFVIAWDALDDAQRSTAIQGPQYRSLTTLLQRRIREQMALASNTHRGQLKALTEFADDVGVPYEISQIVAAEEVNEEVTNDASRIRGDGETVQKEDAEGNATRDEYPVTDPPKVDSTIVQAEGDADRSDSHAAVPEQEDPCPGTLARTRGPFCRDELPGQFEAPELVVLPAGDFLMGSDTLPEEQPPHRVKIAYQIAISLYEITAKEYEDYCRATDKVCPEQVWDEDSPVVSINWNDAVAYADWLSDSTGFQYRLPTEAEWEYAARGGTETPYFFGDEITPSAAHSSENGTVTAPVSRGDRVVNRNPFRLFHMAGNVREWVQDSWYPDYVGAPVDGSARGSDDDPLGVVRGGSYKDPGTKLRSAARESLGRHHRDKVTGFRVVRAVRSVTD